jgi:hypothetical protein
VRPRKTMEYIKEVFSILLTWIGLEFTDKPEVGVSLRDPWVMSLSIIESKESFSCLSSDQAAVSKVHRIMIEVLVKHRSTDGLKHLASIVEC